MKLIPTLKFDSNEYWLTTQWDRDTAIASASPAVRSAWLNQEQLTLAAIEQILRNRANPLRVLDIPCGTGRLSAAILRKFGNRVHVTGLDLNAYTLEIAKQRVGDSLNWMSKCADAYEVGALCPSTFDLVVSLDFIHHVAALPEMLGAIRDAMATNGFLIVNTLAYERYAEWDRMKYGALGSLWRSIRHEIGTLAYHVESARPLVRRVGLSRIAPLNLRDVKACLDADFTDFTLQSDYYHWVSARKR